MKIIINADDYGFSKNSTEDILECVEDGVLNSVSLIPNGYWFEKAAEKIQSHKKVAVAAHLNLCEGHPITPAEEIPYLVDEAGYLKNNFQSLLIKYVKLGEEGRKELVGQIRTELTAQVEKVRDKITANTIHIDSHKHTHVLPFIFEWLASDKNIQYEYIRIPRERFYTSRSRLYTGWLGFNTIKQKWINTVISLGRCFEKAVENNRHHNNEFIGILYTGRMDYNNAKSALKKINPDEDKTLEIMFHPGQLKKGEETFLTDPADRKFYASKNRLMEKKTLTDPRFRKLLKKYGLE